MLKGRKVLISQLFSADSNALVGALIQLLKGVGELVFDDGSDGPLSAHLEAVLGQ